MTTFALGIDIGQTPSRSAIAEATGVRVASSADSTLLIDRIAATVAAATASTGNAPTTVVLTHAGAAEVDVDLLAAVGALPGLNPERVHLIDHDAAGGLGSTFIAESGPPGIGAIDAVAVGAALSGISPQPDRTRAGFLVVAAGGSVAGAAAIPLAAGLVATDAASAAVGAVGPTGVPLAAPSGVGSVGVPLGAPGAAASTGVPLGQAGAAGPDGVAMSGSAVGPAGTAWNRIAVFVGVAAVAVVAIGVAVVATSGGDSSSNEPAAVAPDVVAVTDAATTIAETVTSVSTSVADTVADTVVDVTEPTVAEPSSTVAEPGGTEGAACAVGSWVADNETIAVAFAGFAAADGGAVVFDEITGEVVVEIAADGTVLTTFDGWKMSAILPDGVGTSEVARGGTETSTITFADGVYTVGETTLNSTTTISLAGFVFKDGPTEEPLFQGSSTFTCEGDRLALVIPGAYVATMTRRG